MVFHILRIISWAAAGTTLFTAVDVWFNGGAIVDFTVVCAFGVTACAFGILARIEQAALYNTSTSTPESKPNIPNTRPRIGPPPRIDTPPPPVYSTAVCRNCRNTIQRDQNFCEQCGWQRINPQ